MTAFYDAHPIAFWIMFFILAMSITASRPFKGFVTVRIGKWSSDKDPKKRVSE